jgi:hypothetical protein
MFKFAGLWELIIPTPFGDDRFFLTVNTDRSCILDSELDKYEIDGNSVQCSEENLCIDMQIQTPISANLRLEINNQLDVDNSNIGSIRIADYISHPIRAKRVIK